MSKKDQETIFGWTVERRTPYRVIVRKGDVEHDVKGSADLEGDKLVKRAIDMAMGAEEREQHADGAHVIDVPVGTMAGSAKEI